MALSPIHVSKRRPSREVVDSSGRRTSAVVVVSRRGVESRIVGAQVRPRSRPVGVAVLQGVNGAQADISSVEGELHLAFDGQMGKHPVLDTLHERACRLSRENHVL